MRDRRRTWLTGGSALIISGVLAVLSMGLGGDPAAVYVRVFGDLIYMAAISLFAFGLTRRSSVVARHPLGVVCLIIVGAWPLMELVVLPTATSAADQPVASQPNAAMTVVQLLVPAAAGLVAVIQIGRARILPNPWRWAPACVLGTVTAIWVLPQLIIVTAGSARIAELSSLLTSLGLLSVLLSTIGLGVVAIYLSAKQRPETVSVYRSP